MFKQGHKYFEVIVTGDLGFTGAGEPKLVNTSRLEIYEVLNDVFFDFLKDAPQIFNTQLQRKTKYLRVFTTPVISFDENGDAVGGKQSTMCFYEYDASVDYNIKMSPQIEKIR